MAKALKNPGCGPTEGSGTGSGVMCAGLCGCCVSTFGNIAYRQEVEIELPTRNSSGQFFDLALTGLHRKSATRMRRIAHARPSV